MSERGPNVYAISRDFWSDPDFSDAAFSDREAWLWLIGAAAWKELRTRGSTGASITLCRGEFSFSVRFLAEKWGWSKSAVDRFFAKLEKRDTIRDTSRDGNKVYSIRNYNKFQVVGAPKRDRARDDHRDASGTAPGHERDKEETGVTGVTGVISDRPNITLPLSDPRCGSDGVGDASLGSKNGACADPENLKTIPPLDTAKTGKTTLHRETRLGSGTSGVSEPAQGAAPRRSSDGFERFWCQADPPKHAAKAKARSAWTKVRHVRPPDDVLIACHAAYRASVAAENAKRREERPPRAAQSLCHPEKFLSERRWESFIGDVMSAPAPVIALQNWGERGRRLAAAIGGDAVFAAWFSAAAFVDGEPVTIVVAKPFQLKWIEDHFRQALERVFGATVRVVCEPPGAGAFTLDFGRSKQAV